jgi:hypothetical protein
VTSSTQITWQSSSTSLPRVHIAGGVAPVIGAPDIPAGPREQLGVQTLQRIGKRTASVTKLPNTHKKKSNRLSTQNKAKLDLKAVVNGNENAQRALGGTRSQVRMSALGEEHVDAQPTDRQSIYSG